MTRRAILRTVIAAVALLSVGATAWAYFSSTVTPGTASAAVGTLNAPTGVAAAVTPTGSTTVHVTWTASAGGTAPQGYYVQRTTGGTTSPACGTSATNLTSASSVSCDDTSVPVGTYTYKVVAVYHTWTATSADSNSVSVASAAATKLVFTSSAVSGAASTSPTLGPITVQRQDAAGNPVTTGTTAVTLSSDSGATAKFAATSGGTSATSVSITPGSSSVTFFYADTKAGSPTITATSSLTSPTQSETITPAVVSKLAFTSSAISAVASSTANSSSITVQRQDQFGNAVSTGATTVNLSSDSAGTKIFSPASPVSITAGSSSVSFSYGDTKAGTPTITAGSTSPATLTSATQQETITPAAVKKLAFTSTAISAVASSTANSSSITVQRQDQFGNAVSTGATTVNLSSDSAGTKTFSPASPLSITAGSSSVSFSYGDTKAGTPSITATSTSPISLTSATQQETITAATVSRLVFTSAPVSAVASATANSSSITVQRQDQFGNPVSTGSATVTLTSDSTAGVFSASPLTIAAGNSSASFSYGDTIAGTPMITAASTSPVALSSATQQETITAAAASAMQFVNCAGTNGSSSASCSGQPIAMGNQSGLTFNVRTVDSFGNPSAPVGTITITFTNSDNTFTMGAGSPATITAPSTVSGDVTLQHANNGGIDVLTAHASLSAISDATLQAKK